MRPSRCLNVSLSLVALWIAPTSGVAQSQSPPIQKLLAPDGEAGDSFGYAGVISGNWLIIGAPGDDDAHGEAGALYAYARVGGIWSLAQKVYAHDGQVQTWADQFGYSVAMAGDLLAGGAIHDTNPAGLEAGSVFLFSNQGGTWVQIHRIYSLDCNGGENFGNTVALSANVLVVTAPGADGVSPGTGSVYVFEPQGDKWVQTAELLPADGLVGFGNGPVATSGDTILVGAPYSSALGASVGSVHVFEKVDGAWQETQRLDPPDPGTTQFFGYRIALDGSRAMIVATGVVGPAGSTGAVYVYERGPTQWTLTDALTDTPPDHGIGLTSGVALDGDRAAVGAYGDSPGVPWTGVIYDFALLSGTWTHVARIVPPDPFGDMNFGDVLSLSGHELFAGSAQDSATGYIGAAYVIQLIEPITFLDLGWPLMGVNGLPQLVATGTPLPGKLLQLALSHGKPGATGALILGATQMQMPFKGGMLVPYPDALLPVSTDALGSATLSGAWPAGVPSGAIIAMQWWTADGAGVKGFAASNAIGVLAP